MNAHSMTTRSIKNGSNNMDKFVNELYAWLKINMEAQKHLSYHGMMIRLKSVINVAKMINDGFEHVFHKFVAKSIEQTGKLMSTTYFKMYEMLTESKNAHLKEYIVGENEILNIKKMALKLINPCRKSLNIVFKLIQKFVESDISRVCYINNYHNIKNIQSQLENKYRLRKITAICYAEDDQVDDLSDSDYNPAEDLVKKFNRINKVVNSVINKCNNESDNESDSDYEYDSSSDYDPEDDADDVDDEFEFDDDDYAEESEEDDDDYEDDSVDEEDAQFVSDYYNDPDYKFIKKVKKTSDNDDDYEEEDDADDVDDEFNFNDDDYAEETEEDDDDYEDEESQNLEDKQFLDEYYNDPDYEEDKKANKNSDDDSEYDPADDADDESVDDEFEFDDDDYAEEDDDDYEETEIDEKEDAQFVSDYYNDPDYEEEEDIEDCSVVNDDIQLEGGINYDEDSESVEEIDYSEYERNIVYNYKNNKLENIEFKMYEKGM